MKASRRLIYLLPVALYLGLSIAYLFAIPSGESPDEPSHLQCVEQVSIERRLPKVLPVPAGEWWSRTFIISGYQCYQMPLYYIVSGGLQQATHALTGEPLHYEFPPTHPAWGQSSLAMFAHPPKSSPFDLAEPLTVVALRIESMLLGLATLWAAVRVAQSVFPERPASAQAAAVLVAGWPQFLFMSRAINNDALATALALLSLIILLAAGGSRRFVWASLFASLAILSKLTMLFAALVVWAVWALEWWVAVERRREYAHAGLTSLLPFAGLVLVIAWQPTIREHFAQNLASFNAVQPETYTLTYWQDVLGMTLRSGWARLGWMNVPAPDWQAYLWWAVIGVAGALGLIQVKSPGSTPRRIILLTLGLWGAGVLAGYLRINTNRFQPQFRFLFALLPVLAAFAGAGLEASLERWPRLRQAVIVAIAIGLLLINLWVLAAIVGPAYA